MSSTYSDKEDVCTPGTFSAQAVSSRADLREWISLPRRAIYAPSSPWVPPLDQDLRRMLDQKKNPFFLHGEAQAFLARDKDGNVAGRILAHVSHRHTVRHHERAALFGYFECCNERAAARTLLEAAGAFGRQRGCEVLRGPFNMTAMQEMGIVQDGFHKAPAVDEIYSAPYYPALLQACGLTPTFPVSTFRIDDITTIDVEALVHGERQRRLLADGRLRIRAANPQAAAHEFETLRELLNESLALPRTWCCSLAYPRTLGEPRCVT